MWKWLRPAAIAIVIESLVFVGGCIHRPASIGIDTAATVAACGGGLSKVQQRELTSAIQAAQENGAERAELTDTVIGTLGALLQALPDERRKHITETYLDCLGLKLPNESLPDDEFPWPAPPMSAFAPIDIGGWTIPSVPGPMAADKILQHVTSRLRASGFDQFLYYKALGGRVILVATQPQLVTRDTLTGGQSTSVLGAGFGAAFAAPFSALLGYIKDTFSSRPFEDSVLARVFVFAVAAPELVKPKLLSIDEIGKPQAEVLGTFGMGAAYPSEIVVGATPSPQLSCTVFVYEFQRKQGGLATQVLSVQKVSEQLSGTGLFHP